MMQQNIKSLLSNHFKPSLTISYRLCVKILCIRTLNKRDLSRYHYKKFCSIIINACRIWSSIKCLCFFKIKVFGDHLGWKNVGTSTLAEASRAGQMELYIRAATCSGSGYRPCILRFQWGFGCFWIVISHEENLKEQKR